MLQCVAVCCSVLQCDIHVCTFYVYLIGVNTRMSVYETHICTLLVCVLHICTLRCVSPMYVFAHNMSVRNTGIHTRMSVSHTYLVRLWMCDGVLSIACASMSKWTTGAACAPWPLALLPPGVPSWAPPVARSVAPGLCISTISNSGQLLAKSPLKHGLARPRLCAIRLHVVDSRLNMSIHTDIWGEKGGRAREKRRF